MVAARPAMTSAEFAEIAEDGRFDLVDGEVWALAPTRFPHGKYAGRLATALGIAAQTQGGEIFVAELGFELDETGRTVLCPDVAYVGPEHLPMGEPKTFFRGAPDLAVEVVSESERPRQVQTKVARYLSAGASLVWCVYPEKQQVVVYSSDADLPRILGVEDTLDGGDVLPGFRLPLARLFE